MLSHNTAVTHWQTEVIHRTSVSTFTLPSHQRANYLSQLPSETWVIFHPSVSYTPVNWSASSLILRTYPKYDHFSHHLHILSKPIALVWFLQEADWASCFQPPSLNSSKVMRKNSLKMDSIMSLLFIKTLQKRQWQCPHSGHWICPPSLLWHHDYIPCWLSSSAPATTGLLVILGGHWAFSHLGNLITYFLALLASYPES